MKKFFSVPINEAIIPKEGYVVMLDRWWCTDGNNIFFYGTSHSPQCNRNKKLAEHIMRPNQIVIFLPIVYVKPNYNY